MARVADCVAAARKTGRAVRLIILSWRMFEVIINGWCEERKDGATMRTGDDVEERTPVRDVWRCGGRENSLRDTEADVE